MRWRSWHPSTRWAALAGAILGGALLGPATLAVLLLRCCEATRGPSAGAYVVLGVVLLAGSLLSAVVAGLAVMLLRRLVRRLRAAGA